MSPTLQHSYDRYASTMKKYMDIESAYAILGWDKEVNAPPKSNAIRAQQMATLSGMAHEVITDPALGELLHHLSEQSTQLGPKEQKNIQQSLKEYQREQKFSTAFVMRRSKVYSAAYDAWMKASAANDFAIYQKALTAIFDIKREEAELLTYEDHPYNALIDQYEPGAKVKALDVLFADVKTQLVDFAHQIREQQQVEDAFLFQHFDRDQQWDFGLYVLRNMGYDFEAGRQDISPHPFTTTFGAGDVRVTTRIDEKNLGNMTWSCIHEGGHALYEQGLPSEDYGLPSGKYISLGIHESQSRLWENNVGRSLAYWKAHYPQLQKAFPKQLGSIALNDFYKGINKIAPSLIRTEADEIHYHLHVLIRYELEKAVIEKQLKVADLEGAWNDLYKSYLGVDVPDAKRGILQDIHWAYGNVGYFPTYSLGSFYAAQFFHQATLDLPELSTQIEAGNNQALLDWLRQNIHQYGMQYSADDLCTKLTGEPLNFRYFMDYAKAKYEGIYGMRS
ncbi:MAG: carboxypeptidase M32 [Bacteroidota bacterium]